MSKKVIIPIVVVLVIALGAAGLAYAASTNAQAIENNTLSQFASSPNNPQGLPRLGGRIGQITAIGNNQFTVKTANGEKTVTVDAQTTYHNQAGAPLTFQDLKVGLWVTGKFERSNHQILAKSVLIFPESFNPSAINDRLRGSVVSIDLNGSQFTLKGRGGEEQVVRVDQNTIFLGKVQNLSEMKVDLVAGVGAAKQSDGSLVAILIYAHQPYLRHAGSITAVDLNANTFTLKTLASGELTFKVDPSTQFRSPNNQVKSLADLKIGEAAVVIAEQNADGSLTAERVAAASRAQIKQWLQKYDVRAAGQVLLVNGSSFTIQNVRGQQMTFQVSSQTQFLGRDKSVSSLQDLKAGMKVLVGGKSLGNNQFEAQVVAVAK